MTVDFLFDYLSPYAWFASLRVRQVAQAHGAQVRPVPVVLGAVLAHHGHLGPAEIPAKRIWTYKDIRRIAHTLGVRVVGPAVHPFNPLTALRLSQACVAGDQQWAVIDALFAAGWGGGADLQDPAVLEAALDRAGLPGADWIAATRTPSVKGALKDTTAWAIERGCFGVPTFLVGDELVFGNDRLDQVAMLLQGQDPVDPADLAEHLGRPQMQRKR